MAKYFAIMAMFMVFLAALFIVGQASIIPVTDSIQDTGFTTLKDDAGNEIVSVGTFSASGQRAVFQWMPYIIMIGVVLMAVMFYIRLTQVRGGGGF